MIHRRRTPRQTHNPKSARKRAELGDSKSRPTRSARLYREFHGAAARKTTPAQFREPKPREKLVVIGTLEEVVYAPASPSQHAGKKLSHLFGDYGFRMGKTKPVLAVSEDGKQLYIVNGKSRYKFGKRGIVG